MLLPDPKCYPGSGYKMLIKYCRDSIPRLFVAAGFHQVDDRYRDPLAGWLRTRSSSALVLIAKREWSSLQPTTRALSLWVAEKVRPRACGLIGSKLITVREEKYSV